MKSYEWVFSGIGVAVITFLINKIFKKKNSNTNNSISRNSMGIQAGRDIDLKINQPKDEQQQDQG
jgi:hypothetical protein